MKKENIIKGEIGKKKTKKKNKKQKRGGTYREDWVKGGNG